jgi:hypothetical protein
MATAKTLRIRAYFRALSKEGVTDLPNPLRTSTMSDYFAHLETPRAPQDDAAAAPRIPAFENVAELSAFVHAGDATFTLVSEKTGKRFTYRVQYPKDKETGRIDRSAGIMFASVLVGPDNTRNYAYFGNIRRDCFQLGRKSKLAADAPSVVAFAWFYRALTQQRLPASLKVYHMGRCGRCNRPLTVPESIRAGIGPECATRSDGF